MPNDGIKIHEVYIPGIGFEHMKNARIVFRLTRRGQTVKSLPDCEVHQVEIPVARLKGLTRDQIHNLLLKEVRDYSKKIDEEILALDPAKDLEGYEFDEVDEGKDKPIPDRKEKKIDEDLI